ncbi:MYG1 family protein [Pelagicoccus sp. SDUM812003]|uniref:MYG1 family protein n=1 Tax=Pelagicoccus sp. SDUM812003 TaxID=3041267 RepID=UPI00280CF393|nr:MYG1 family protein [Pelagicoccus sp. SDUM812003]MDQ8201372.1 MYG1 family protein [Pelagicoccus sp. SDUM812003]
MSEATFTHILTHPGSAHKDDLLACCLLLAFNPAPILRKEPAPHELADPHVAIVDVGDSHEPENGNFDHHQFPRDAAPSCALSLVLQYYGLYEDAKQFCEWLEPAEWFDCRGANKTAQWLGVEREIIGKLNSPIDVSLLRRFAASPSHQPGEPVWEMMRMVGQDLVEYLSGLRQRLNEIDRSCQIWKIDEAPDQANLVLFLPRVDPLPEEPSAGIGHYLRQKAIDGQTIGTIYPDRRNTGYGISRYNDHPLLDFTRIEGESDVHFAHKSGFVAKTTATDPKRLRQLLLLGLKTT